MEEFLSRGGTSLEAVLNSVDDWLETGSDDILLAVGSLAEGMGSRKSDLDLLLISHGPPTALPKRDEVIWAMGRCAVDVRILHHERIKALLSRLKDWARQPWDASDAAKFSHDERVLLHRLKHAQVLKSGRGLKAAELFAPALSDLACLKLHVARHAAKTIQVDMVGYREHCDFATLGFSAQKLLGHAIDALLAGHLMTNPLSKWRCRYLQRLPQDWHLATGTRPQARTAVDAYWHLHRLPAHPEDEQAMDHALAITAFARAVFMWAEYRLVLGMQPPAQKHIGTETSLPHLALDVDYCLTPTGGIVARLNEFETGEGKLDLSHEDLAMLPLFNGGSNTPSVPASPIAGEDSPPGPAISALLRRMEACGHLAEPLHQPLTPVTALGRYL